MHTFDQLELVTEISATLLGFVAVFLALSNREGKFLASDRHFVQALVVNSAYCLVLGLSPRALSLFLVSSFWLPSLVIAAVGGLVVSTVMAWTQLRMSQKEKAKVNGLWHVPPWGLALVATTLIVVAFFHMEQASAYYVGATTLLVGISVWCFIAVVFRRFF
jgi:flagellar biosynthesis protein FliQ